MENNKRTIYKNEPVLSKLIQSCYSDQLGKLRLEKSKKQVKKGSL